MNRKSKDRPDLFPLTPEDVQRAIELSGYPLEVELLEELMAAKVPCGLGQRVEVAHDEFKEIDVTATFVDRTGISSEVGPIVGTFRLLTQVKRPAPPGVFAAVARSRIRPSNVHLSRLGLSGSILDEDISDPAGHELMVELAGAMQVFDESPICAHWALVRRRKDAPHEPWASGEEGFFDDFSTLVRSRAMLQWHARESRTQPRAPRAATRVTCIGLVLVIDQPVLFVYDPVKREQSEVAHLTVLQSFDTIYGPQWAAIDCVARSGFTAHVERCRIAFERVFSTVKAQPQVVVDLVKRTRDQAATEYLNSLPRS